MRGKIFGIALVILAIFSICGALPGIANVEPVSGSSAIIYVPDDYTKIQWAVDNATSGDTIIVRDGTYTENVDVNKEHLTIKSENGAEVTIVQAASSDDDVFTVTENWVAPLGEINSTEIINTTVVVLGNPTHHIATNYYENHGFTPISLSENSTHFILVDDSTQIVGTLHKQALESGHQDMFVVQAFKDGKNDFLVIYGVGWRGTWAASIYLANAILKDLAEYSNAYFVFNWVDDGIQDGIPQFSEISKANFG